MAPPHVLPKVAKGSFQIKQGLFCLQPSSTEVNWESSSLQIPPELDELEDPPEEELLELEELLDELELPLDEDELDEEELLLEEMHMPAPSLKPVLKQPGKLFKHEGVPVSQE